MVDHSERLLVGCRLATILLEGAFATRTRDWARLARNRLREVLQWFLML